MGSETLKLLSPGICKYVEALLRDGKIGICCGPLQISNVGSSSTTVSRAQNGDRFKLTIPFAGQVVIWEVIFNGRYPEQPPDFIFGDDQNGFLPDIDKIHSLVKWDHTDSGALLRVIGELVREYKLHQLQLVMQNSRLQFEYTSLLEHDTITEKDVEVNAVKKNEHSIGPINFLVRLPIDFERIPAYLTQDNPGEDTAFLGVTFQTPDDPKAEPSLYLSPRVEHALGGSSSLRIPPFPHGGCLIDYVPQVCELLTNKVDTVIQGHEKKKEYVGAFLSHFGRCIVEYDSENFSYVMILQEWHNFYFTVLVSIPKTFPAHPPAFTFCSVYHESHTGAPFVEEVKDYPYSPRWSGNEMAERARAYFLEHVSSFQRASVSGGQIGH